MVLICTLCVHDGMMEKERASSIDLALALDGYISYTFGWHEACYWTGKQYIRMLSIDDGLLIMSALRSFAFLVIKQASSPQACGRSLLHSFEVITEIGN